MNITEKMQSLISEAEEGSMDVEMKAVLPQLVLAMQAMGMDPHDEEHQDKFIGMLKKLATNKAALMRSMKMFTGMKAKKAIKTARETV